MLAEGFQGTADSTLDSPRRGHETKKRRPKERMPSVARPFLSWAGGKRRIVPHLLPFLPEGIGDLVYHEPFLGAGSLFFAVRPSRAILSDANEHLVACFVAVRDYPDVVSRSLEKHRRLDSREHYYAARNQYNRSRPSAAQAARFIYLNKACFNGIFRVNRADKFNVPYGRHGSSKQLQLPGKADLRLVSAALEGVTLRAMPYERAVGIPSENDFYYLDPPYPPLNGTSYFTHYTKERFTYQDHEAVAALARFLDSQGSRVMVSNADTPEIRKLFKGFNIQRCQSIHVYPQCAQSILQFRVVDTRVDHGRRQVRVP